MSANLKPYRNGRKESTEGNSGFKKLAAMCLNEHLCFVTSSVVAGSFVLRNRQLLLVENHYAHHSI